MKNILIGVVSFIVIIYSAIFLSSSQIPDVPYLDLNSPRLGQSFNPGDTVNIRWTSDGIDHFQIWYTTDPTAACSGESSVTPCPGRQGSWNCIESHPYSLFQYSWSAPDINSSSVRVRIEGHYASHDTQLNVCSNSFTIAQSPTKPENPKAITINSTSILVTWEAGTGIITHYMVFREGINIKNTTTLYFLDTGLYPGSTYRYYLVSYGAGESDKTGNATNQTFPTPLSITSYSPLTPVTSEEYAQTTFSINTNQIANVDWYFNKTKIQTNNGVSTSSYVNNSGILGTWNITATASNENGTISRQWMWNVIPVINIGFVQPTDPDGGVVLRNWTYINATINGTLSISACILQWNVVNISMSLAGTGKFVYCSYNKTDIDGNHSYRVYVNDSNNKWNASSRSIRLNQAGSDVTPPNITVYIPNVTANGTMISITVIATDASNIHSIWAFIMIPGGGSLTTFLNNSQPYNYITTTTGTYNITVYANDTLNNTAAVTYSFESVIGECGDSICSPDEDSIFCNIDCPCIEESTYICGDSNDGECRFGIQTCVNGTWGFCQGAVLPSTEICNGIDDDCNGVLDDSSACCSVGQTSPCGPANETGICRQGVKRCINGVFGPVCENVTFAESSDRCYDNLDNDCDGQTDENCDTCTNGEKDGDEEGTDCGGSCPDQCTPEVVPIIGLILIIAGIAVFIVLLFLYSHFKSQGKSLTWEELRKKWTPAGKI